MGNVVWIAILGAGLIALGTLCALAVLPQLASAAQMEADAMCNPVIPVCGCMQVMGPKGCIGGANMYMCPCFDITSGFKTTGICLAPNKCLGQSVGGMMPMLPMIPMMMSMPMMSQDPCMQPGAGNTAATSTSSPASSNPCGGAFDSSYFGEGSSIFDTSSYFNDTSSGISGSLFDDLNQPASGAVNNFLNSTSTATTTRPPITPTTTSNLTGSIKIGEVGATIIGNLREGVAEVAGFFGGATLGGSSSQSVVGRLCASRPWAGVVSKMIPPAFFDTLCSKAGYQVGVSTPPPPTQQVAVPKKKTPVQAMPPKAPVDLGSVEIDIWAEPSSVRLGARTYIFWRSQGVLDCTVSGPNFTQSALAGGASTVPLSGATTYTLECGLPDGTKVSDSVTVQLAL